MKEIERKWILPKLPELGSQSPILYERHFIFIGEALEVRVQKKGNKYEFERKVETSDLTRVGQKFEISEEEFNHFKQFSMGSLVRESYIIDEISIKVYKEKFLGLIRAEVEFNSEEEANQYVLPKWFGKEITDSPIGRDKSLIHLSESRFKKLLDKYLDR